ncbi:NAD(P)-binding protein [Podospora fimiseda]|uniref:NAD(P)-binding protein n=1 Tax=Podospora fimiseda TaxID=252190 RepID=A0AAN6YN66_9PEZI|nr:NAD(P)-binding protein [Podospora fimiseda]
MSTILITGTSRGLGYEFLRQYSATPENTVLGIVRNKAVTAEKIASDPELSNRTNIHLLEADLTNYAALKKASEDAAPITGGKLDILIANAAYLDGFDAYDAVGKLGADPDELTKYFRQLFEVNVIGNVHLFNIFLPLILAGHDKKVIAISTGFADPVFTNEWDIEPGALYASSKAAMNMLVAKYSAQYKKDGVLFLSICPGMVETSHYKNPTEEQKAQLGGLMQKFQQYAPRFSGPSTPEKSIASLRKTIADVSIEKGHGGDFISHLGGKRWL